MTPQDARDPKDDRALVRTIVLSQFAPPFLFSGVAVGLPDLGADLGAGSTALGLVETTFLAGSAALLLPVGRVADGGGARGMYRAGLLWFGLLSLAVAALSWVPGILALRALQGFASAVIAVTGPAILVQVVPGERRGRVFGAVLGVVYAGLTLGPLVAGQLVSLGGWRLVFAAGGAGLLAAWWAVRHRLPAALRWPAGAVHAPSALLAAASATCAVTGASLAGRGALAPSLLAAAALLAAAFAALQLRLSRPLLDVRALAANRVLARALSAQALVYCAAFAPIFLLNLFVQVVLGRTPAVAGRTLALGTVAMAVTAPFAGALADRFRPPAVAACGIALVVASSLNALRLDADSGLLAVAGTLALQGFGFGLFAAPNTKAILGSVPDAAAATASALAATARSVGIVGGMLVASFLVAAELGDAPLRSDPARLQVVAERTFAVLAVLAFAALFAGGLGGPSRRAGAGAMRE